MAIEYKKAILSYLDILGFRRLVETSKSPDEILSILRTTTTKTKASMGVLKMDGTMKSWTKTRNFSDLIVRHTEVAVHHNVIERLNIEIQFLAQMQCELMARDGILLRGGLCLRECHIDDEFIFGPAPIESYRLEDQIAVFPRVVIDANVIELVSRQSGDLWAPSIRRGEDAAYFIDYLYAGYKSQHGFAQTSFKQRKALVTAHMEKIVAKLKESILDERAKQKLLWAALYHNSVIQRLKVDGEQLEESLMIPEELLN
jgi:hypothetical protein